MKPVTPTTEHTPDGVRVGVGEPQAGGDVMITKARFSRPFAAFLAAQQEGDTPPSVSPLTGTEEANPGAAPPAAHIRNRLAMREFVIHEAKPWHREHLTRLYAAFDDWNVVYFGSQLCEPYLMLLVPTSTRSYGDTSRVSGFGGQLQIRIRPSLLSGTHTRVRPESKYAEGRYRFVADVLLHEMVHQWQFEVIDVHETSYHGHGPTFRDKANEIGSLLSLPPVRLAKARGKEKALPSCAQWPHNVRPEGYYLGAVVEVPASGDTDEGEGETDGGGDREEQLIDELSSLATPSLVRVLVAVLNRWPERHVSDPDGFHALIGAVIGELEEERQADVWSWADHFVGLITEEDTP